MRIGRSFPPAVVRRAVAAAESDGAVVNGVFEEGFDVVMTPMFTRRPLRVGEYEGRGAMWTLAGSVRFVPWCGLFNHTGQPAAAVPAGFAGDGFPLSVQLIAAPQNEDVLLSLAAQLERAREWAAHVPAIAQ
jgi:amidase